MKRTTRWIAPLLAAAVSFAGLMQSAHAGLVSTEQVAAAEGVRTATSQRAALNAALSRADVQAGLAERGVSVEQARARVAALTDDEVAVVAETIETAPAGASDVLGVLLTVFVVLLITDILGFTKVFPFTRSIR